MQIWTADSLSGLRDGSKSLLHHLKSFLGPPGSSEPVGQTTQIPSARRSPGSEESGGAPAHPGDALLVAPLGDQSSALICGRRCRKALESECFGERHCLFRVLLRAWAVPPEEVVFCCEAGSRGQSVRIGRPLSHLQHLARFRPRTIGIAKPKQAYRQVAVSTYPI